ncbi:MAG TPA: lipase [Lachnospiraceae bacterium]|nr:lipase [Lachnospiraceae bacterium]
MSEYILSVKNVKKNFGGVKALDGVSLDIKRGEIHCLAGENGSGKSTLIKIISGVEPFDAGTIEFDGIKQKKLTPAISIASGIQVIYQDFSIFPNLTVMENLSINNELTCKGALVNWKRMQETAKKALSKINFKVNLKERVEDLSVAEKQLVAISRALLNSAKLIIMDEPTTALTKKEVKKLFTIIKDLQAKGISILFVSHKMDEVFEISERFTILRNGKNVITGNTADLNDKKFTFYMTGREFDDLKTNINYSTSKVVLDVQKLQLNNIFKEISFQLHEGEILGITGLLGSGRTELAETIFGLRTADGGRIFMDGKSLKIRCVEDAIEHKIGYVPEDRLSEGLFLSQSISSNISVCRLKTLSSRAGFYNKNKVNQEVENWIRNLSIATNNALLPVQSLSGGNQQKVLLARWLANNLRVLILNGPTVGVDIGAKYDIHERIRNFAKGGLSLLVISDDIPELFSLCNRIIVMNKGRFTMEVVPAKISEKKLEEISMSE